MLQGPVLFVLCCLINGDAHRACQAATAAGHQVVPTRQLAVHWADDSERVDPKSSLWHITDSRSLQDWAFCPHHLQSRFDLKGRFLFPLQQAVLWGLLCRWQPALASCLAKLAPGIPAAQHLEDSSHGSWWAWGTRRQNHQNFPRPRPEGLGLWQLWTEPWHHQCPRMAARAVHHHLLCFCSVVSALPGGPAVNNPPANAGDTSSIPGPEDPTCHRATEPMHHNCWSPHALKPMLCKRRSHSNEKPEHHN